MQVKLIEVEPGRWRVDRRSIPVARSSLPCPSVISDSMDAVEQVDGKFYTSKSQFRAVGRSLGLIEVGNEKPKPLVRSTDQRAVKDARRKALRTAAEKFKAGHRAR